ncbi:MAG TPA: hypothetical protein VF742_08120 [Terracidiphilus sp.]
MTEKKLGPSDFQAEVERLRATGQLPSLEEVLDAVADAREKFSPRLLKVRERASASDCLSNGVDDREPHETDKVL